MGERMHFGEQDQYFFGQATHYDIYKKLGAHLTTVGEKKVYTLLSGHLMQPGFLWLVNLMNGSRM